MTQAHQLSLPLHAEQFLLQLERPLLVGTKEGTKYNKSLFLSIAHACAELFPWYSLSIIRFKLLHSRFLPGRHSPWLWAPPLHNQHAQPKYFQLWPYLKSSFPAEADTLITRSRVTAVHPRKWLLRIWCALKTPSCSASKRHNSRGICQPKASKSARLRWLSSQPQGTVKFPSFPRCSCMLQCK